MSVNKVVYCNICPLKELCPHAEPDNAYYWSRGNYAPTEEQEQWFNRCDYGALQRATSLCPLRSVFR